MKSFISLHKIIQTKKRRWHPLHWLNLCHEIDYMDQNSKGNCASYLAVKGVSTIHSLFRNVVFIHIHILLISATNFFCFLDHLLSHSWYIPTVPKESITIYKVNLPRIGLLWYSWKLLHHHVSNLRGNIYCWKRKETNQLEFKCKGKVPGSTLSYTCPLCYIIKHLSFTQNKYYYIVN